MATVRFAAILLLCFLFLPTPMFLQAASGTKRIGIFNPQGVPASIEEALRQGLAKLGHVEGKNLAIEWRRDAATDAQMRTAAAQLAAPNIDLIVALGSPAARAALDATTKPVVFTSGDPVAAGFVHTLARPGGTATGVSLQTTDLNRKRLELLRLLVPETRRIAYLSNYANPLKAPDLAEIQGGAKALGVALVPLRAGSDAEIDALVPALRQSQVDGVVVSADYTLLPHRAKISDAIRQANLPAVFPYREFHDAGALMSYSPNMEEAMFRLASYVDRILAGAKPGDLPVEQISTYEVVIDLRVARDMHLRVSQDLILRADAVLQ